MIDWVITIYFALIHKHLCSSSLWILCILDSSSFIQYSDFSPSEVILPKNIYTHKNSFVEQIKIIIIIETLTILIDKELKELQSLQLSLLKDTVITALDSIYIW